MCLGMTQCVCVLAGSMCSAKLVGALCERTDDMNEGLRIHLHLWLEATQKMRIKTADCVRFAGARPKVSNPTWFKGRGPKAKRQAIY